MTTKKKLDYAALIEARIASKARRRTRAQVGLKPELWRDVIAAEKALETARRQAAPKQAKLNQSAPWEVAEANLAEARAAYDEASVWLIFEARTPAEARAISEAAVMRDEDGKQWIDTDLHAQLTVDASLIGAETPDGEPVDVPLETLRGLVAAADAGEHARLSRACAQTTTVDFLSSQA